MKTIYKLQSILYTHIYREQKFEFFNEFYHNFKLYTKIFRIQNALGAYMYKHI